MPLNQYLRELIQQLVRPLYIKKKCENCTETESLHLHHVKLFSEIVKETLDDIGLINQNIEDYHEKELSLIVDIVLGKHLQIEYLTLCDKCHKIAHEYDWKDITVNDKHRQHYEDKSARKKLLKELYLEKVLPSYLESVLWKRLNKLEQEHLIHAINMRDNQGRLIKSIGYLNVYLKENNIVYSIQSKRTTNIINGERKRISYWQVSIALCPNN